MPLSEGPLEPGPYLADPFVPRFVFLLGDGWHGGALSESFIELSHPDITLAVVRPTHVIGGDGPVPVSGRRPGRLLLDLARNEPLDVTGGGPADVGRASGFDVDVSVEGDADQELLRYEGGSFFVRAGEPQHVWVLDLDGVSVVVAAIPHGVPLERAEDVGEEFTATMSFVP